ncbi:MAG TPA: PH domain-containing protein [Candidatus Bipolaricaulota bacterium]|nr:PH domain-containing protein [Candidatus Bipolaricaulota bacterium]
MNILHEEKQSFSPIGTLLVFAVLIVIGYCFVSSYRADSVSEAPDFANLVMVFVFLLDGFVFVNFRRLSVTVTDENMIVGYGLLKRKIKLEEIEDVKVDEYKWQTYLGYGIRIGRDRSRGYVARSGNGVRLKIENQPDYFITSDNADQLAAAVKNAIASSNLKI